MEVTVELLIQGGGFALLTYLIVWGTRVGGPKLFDALGGIRVAIETNNQKLDRVEDVNRQLVAVVSRLARETKSVGEHTIQALEKQVNDGKPGG